MSWSMKIGSISGTAIRIHITFILFLAWIFGTSYVSGGAEAAWSGLLFMVLLFLCVLAHEFGHILTARGFGILTPDVVLLPIGGVARLERIPEEPRKEFLIAIAGPLVNVAIAFGLVLVTSATPDGGSLATVESAKVSMVDRLASVNLFLAIFNLIPAFPMDGGRILRAALSARFGFVRATEIAATVGQWVAFVLGFIGLFGSPMLVFIAIFVYLAASAEAHMVALRSLSQGVPVGAATMTQFAALTPESRIDEAIELLLRTSQSEFPIVDHVQRPVGILSRADLIRVLKESGPEAHVKQATLSPLPTCDRRCTLEDALKLLQEKGAPAVGVLDAAGRLVGLVSSETLGEMLMIAGAMPPGYRLGGGHRRAAA
ncbi:site-2 protease family protein [Bradyrhizobium retamae]|uniref:Zinc metalloprotease n=1 Tax=Bradyrhizobium retamae TaxID=1300035 RepID=A0A0R3N618_9BRAD|nr:site-2 protease family protein [Bradyrhizobium retamae]KRR27643.1 protease [Bradyrhizobium retamae]